MSQPTEGRAIPDSSRQEHLRRCIRGADPERGIVPFAKQRLAREDIEWMVREYSSTDLCLAGVSLNDLDLSGIILLNIDLRDAFLWGTNFQGAVLARADLRGAGLVDANLRGADLQWAHLEGADLRSAALQSANLQYAYFSNETELDHAQFGDKAGGYACLRSIHWDGADLSGVQWNSLHMLGEEAFVRQVKKPYPYQHHDEAIQANRQLVSALGGQGLNEEADRFAFRTQALRRLRDERILRDSNIPTKYRLRALGRWLVLSFFGLLGGYGFKPLRTLCCYVAIVCSFWLFYLVFGQSNSNHLSPQEALVFSVTSFHGRGFFPGQD